MEPNTINSKDPSEPNIPPSSSMERNALDVSTTNVQRNAIRTMRSDIDETIKKQDETLVSIALAEEKKKEEERKAEITQAQKENEESQEGRQAPPPRERISLIIMIILVLAIAGFSFALLLPKLRTIKIPSLPSFKTPAFNPPPPVPVVSLPPAKPTVLLAPSLIPVQSEKRLSINNDSPAHILAMIAVEETAGLPPGNVENLYFTEKSSRKKGAPLETIPLTAERLILFSGIPTPEILARSLQESFMTGLFGEKEGAIPFIILKVSDYETGLAGILAFEKDIPYLFSSVFGTKIDPVAAQKKPLFHSITILGRDARSFEISPSQSIAYAFADANTIVIAGSRNTLGEIMLRIAGK